MPGFGMGLPFQLPMPSHLFGRDAELAALEGLLAGRDQGSPLVIVLAGAAGIGKSALALRWLRCTRPGRPFSDGQLYAALGPRSLESPQDVLGRWLRSIGVPAQWIPAGGPQRTSLWRKASAGRRLAIMIDGATSAEEIRELLPGPGPAIVVATTRHEVSPIEVDKDGTQVVALMPLSPYAALSLLRHASGAKRLAADLDAALALARLCGHVPLALRCAAGLLAIQEGREVASVLGALEAEHELTGASPGSEAGIRAILNLTYAALSPAAARAYRLLSLHPGPDLGGSLAAAMLGTSTGDAAAAIEELRRARLLEDAGGDRFRFHDVVRGHASELVSHNDLKADRDAADEKNVGWHLHHAAAAERLLLPCESSGRRDALDVADCPPEFDTAGQALDWLAWERHNLTAALTVAARCCPQACWQLADALWPLWYYRGHWGEALRIGRIGLIAARGCADPDAQARLHDRVGIAYYHLGLYTEAGESFRAGQGNWVSLQPGHGNSLHGLTLPQHFDGWTAEKAGEWQHAVKSYRDAVSVYAQAGDTWQSALAKIDLGRVLPRAGVISGAINVLREAVDSLTAIPDPYNAARARMVLGRYLLPAEDMAMYLLALTTMEDLRALPEQVGILCALAAIAGLRGDQGQARAYYEQSLAIVPDWRPETGQIRTALAALPGAGTPQ